MSFHNFGRFQRSVPKLANEKSQKFPFVNLTHLQNTNAMSHSLSDLYIPSKLDTLRTHILRTAIQLLQSGLIKETR